jgi:hypothetical protein
VRAPQLGLVLALGLCAGVAQAAVHHDHTEDEDEDHDDGDGKFDTGKAKVAASKTEDADDAAAEAVMANRDAGSSSAPRLRTSLTTLYYGEASSDPELASPVALTYADLRARLEVDHLAGSRWSTTDDLRLRLAADDGARGYLGGREVDLGELWLGYTGTTTTWRVGRVVADELDASTFDGTSLAFKLKAGWQLGVVGGFYPNPFSRSLDTDYAFAPDDDRTLATYPAGGGTWLAYRSGSVWGSVGLGAIAPRAQSASKEDSRIYGTARGYWRVNPELNLFHDLVLDAAGSAGFQLTRGILGVTYRPTPTWYLEAGYSHMSSYAIEVFLRDLLTPSPSSVDTGQEMRPINNLDVVRLASDEGRFGITWMEHKLGLATYGMLRVRRRDTIATPDLQKVIIDLPAETQVDVSLGLRKLDLFSRVNLQLDAAYLSGDRTTTKVGTLRMWRAFMKDKLEAELDLGYTAYEDGCPPISAEGDLTCTGTETGTTLRGGAVFTYVHDRHWMGFLSYEYARNSGTLVSAAPRADLSSNMMILRLQYRY